MKRKPRKSVSRPKTKLRIIREQKGYTQEYMAKQFGYQQSWFSKVELGKLLTVGSERRIIAKLLGCKVSDLFTLKTKQPKRITMRERKSTRRKTK
jgi:transcriptional regulator with XRE-family HTH domain